MENDYYGSLIAEIKRLLQLENYGEAQGLIDAELRMPYVPADALQQLEELKHSVEQHFQREKILPLLNAEELRWALKGSWEEACRALDSLSRSNIRNYLEPIQEYLADESADRLLVSLLLEQCMLQQLNSPLSYYHEGQRHTVVAADLPAPLAREVLQESWKLLTDLFENHNPSFLKQCQQVLIQYAYLQFPQDIEDDYLTLSYRVIRYVYRAYDDEAGWLEFAARLNLDLEQIKDIAI